MQNKNTIVVSGCTRGIGRAVCDLFARKGYNVAGFARNESDLKKMMSVYSETYPGQSFYFSKADAAIKDEVIRFGNQAIQTFGKIDILVNNAGFFRNGSIMQENEDALESMMHHNFYSAYHLTRALGKHITQHIFNLCSIASLSAYDGGSSYTISKFALRGFSMQLRHELKHAGIKVTSILPGAVLTESWNGTTLPPERFIQPEDIALTLFSATQLSKGAVIEEIIIRPQEGDL